MKLPTPQSVAAMIEDEYWNSSETVEAIIDDRKRVVEACKDAVKSLVADQSYDTGAAWNAACRAILARLDALDLSGGQPKAKAPKNDWSEVKDCGCTVTKGYRCPMHDGP
jgi:hypothetical protein